MDRCNVWKYPRWCWLGSGSYRRWTAASEQQAMAAWQFPRGRGLGMVPNHGILLSLSVVRQDEVMVAVLRNAAIPQAGRALTVQGRAARPV